MLPLCEGRAGAPPPTNGFADLAGRRAADDFLKEARRLGIESRPLDRSVKERRTTLFGREQIRGRTVRDGFWCLQGPSSYNYDRGTEQRTGVFLLESGDLVMCQDIRLPGTMGTLTPENTPNDLVSQVIRSMGRVVAEARHR